MSAILGLTLLAVLSATFVLAEVRSADYGLTLSNGVEVMVGPSECRRVFEEYQSLAALDGPSRWDQAVLNVLKPPRPREWLYLAHTLTAGRLSEASVSRAPLV